jgi:hypothetical protein
MMAAIRPPMAPLTAPAVEQFFHVMEKAMGMTAEPIMMPMNCSVHKQQQQQHQDDSVEQGSRIYCGLSIALLEGALRIT